MGAPMLIGDLKPFRRRAAEEQAQAKADAPDDAGVAPVAIGDLKPFRKAHDEPSPAPEPAREQPWYDQALSFLHGASGHIADEGAALVSKLDPRNKDLSYDELANSYRQQGDQVRAAHPYYHGAGQAALGIGAAALAGPGVAAQGIASGAAGALSNYGDTHDLGDASLAGVGSAILGAGAAKIGQGMGRLFGRSPGPAMDPLDAARAQVAPRIQAWQNGELSSIGRPAMDALSSRGAAQAHIATQDIPPAAADAIRAQAAQHAPGWIDAAWDKVGRHVVPIPGKPRAAAFRGLADMMGAGGAPTQMAAPAIPNEAARWGTIGALKLGVSEAKAKLTANQGVVDWAVKSVLGGGEGHGLPPHDAQSLNQALMSGNAQKMSSLVYTLTSKFPAFAAAIAAKYKRANDAQESSHE